MPVKALKEFLDNQGIKFVALNHSRAYTANEVAQSAHIPGRLMAKTVVVKIDGELALTVLPASSQVSLERLKEAIGAQEVVLAREAEFKARFPDCELGAMPPFGNLYGMEVYVADGLAHEDEIAFNAGTHTEVIKLAYADFERLVKPHVMTFVAPQVL
jgi:Ala-tRNA(Pro) deacylase